MRARILLLAVPIVIAVSCPVHGASLQVFGGSAWSIPTPLTIRQEGYPEIDIGLAKWRTKPFYESPYYAVRLAGSRWALEIVHHKLYLPEGTHPEVQQFWVSHGYNLVLLERLSRSRSCNYWLGAGVVLAHPETIVRGQELSDPPHADLSLRGFYLGGPAVAVSASRTLVPYRNLSLIAEVKASAAWARIPVAGGYADVPNLAVHGVIGLGVGF